MCKYLEYDLLLLRLLECDLDLDLDLDSDLDFLSDLADLAGDSDLDLDWSPYKSVKGKGNSIISISFIYHNLKFKNPTENTDNDGENAGYGIPDPCI